MAGLATPFEQSSARDSIRRPRTLTERLDPARRVTALGAGIVVLLVALILLFITLNGIELFTQSGQPLSDIVAPTWAPDRADPTFGMLPFILGTVAVMTLAAVISTPLSV